MGSQATTAPTTVRSERLPFLDQLRGVAIVLVFLYHSFYQAFGRDELTWSGWTRDFHAPAALLTLYPITWGWCGVAIFFALSGFSIHLSHVRASKDTFTDYLIRRLFRIYPPFLAALLFFAFIFPRTRLDLHTHWGLAQFGSHLLLLHNLNSRTDHGIATAWWSIAVEFQLYLLYPLLLMAARRFSWRTVLVGTAVIELGLRLTFDVRWLATGQEAWVPLRDSPFSFWYSWAIGAAIADAYLKGEPLPFANWPTLLWLALFVAADLFKPLNSFAFTFAALASATLLAKVLSRRSGETPARRSLFGAHFAQHLQTVGICSYSIYLIHHPIVEAWPGLINRLLPAAHLHPPLMYACCLSLWLLILPAAWLMYRYIEQPAIGAGKALIARRRQQASARSVTAAA